MGKLNDIINEYAEKKPVRFHMPGHKGREINTENKLDYSHDITELFFTDNLYNPDKEINLIYELEKRISKVFFENKDIFSLISCSGATLCIQTAILSLVKLKKKQKESDVKNMYIICDRASHISFMNIISLLNITPLWVYPSEDFTEKIGYYFENYEDIIGVFVTSPDYFGNMKNIKYIADECEKHSFKLVVDNSHGSHTAFYKNGVLHPINLGADISIDSIHKTLPVLTGAAVIHVNQKVAEEKDFFRQSMNMFASTSPSFLILQSIEKMLDLLEERGIIEHERLINYINLFKEKAKSLNFVFKTDGFFDPYRIVLNCENSGEKLYYFLVEKNIFCEFFDKDNVIILTSISNNPDDFEKLFKVLKLFSETDKILSKEQKIYSYPPGVPVSLPPKI